MINNTIKILAQNIIHVEGILMELMHKIVKGEKEKELNKYSLEVMCQQPLCHYLVMLINSIL